MMELTIVWVRRNIELEHITIAVLVTWYNRNMTLRVITFFLKAAFVLSWIGTAVAQQPAVVASAPVAIRAPHEDIKIPFQLENRTIFIQVHMGDSQPYWFVLDTGWKYAVIDLAVAKALGLKLGAPVDVGGGGKKAVLANMLIDSTFSMVGLKDFSQPLFLALPLDDLAKASGHEWAGILGTDLLASSL
jgi:hypothetical protein